MTHQVYLVDRPVSFSVEEGETLLAAGLRQHLAMPFGCQSGGCGSCRVRLTAGEVEYPFPPPALSQGEIDAGYILMCLARAKTDLKLDLHQPPQIEELRPRKLPSRVLYKRMLSHDVIQLMLKLPKGDNLRYLPGQYLDILLEDGRRRSFSIGNAPNGETLELHLRIAPGGRFAKWVLEEMPEKAILRLEAPLGAFYVREDSDRPIILMAGGTGFSPAKAMLEDLLPKQSSRSVHLFWGGRAQEDLYMDDELLDPSNKTDDWRTLLDGRRMVRKLEWLSENQLEALDTWRRGTRSDWSANEEVRIRDLSEHVDRLLDHARDQERDIEAAVQLHFSSVTHQTNKIVQTLTVLSAIFFPLTLITGIYGMNFQNMPELHWEYGYYFALALLAVIGGGLLYIFKRRGFF